MCRHLAYLGPPVPLSALLFDPPHALAVQAWAPRDMRGGGTINADGYGVGWFPPGGGPPVRLRRDRPIWSDLDLSRLAAATAAPAVLAAVRSATTGMPVTETACAPFLAPPGDAGDGWLFSLNGRIIGWPGTVAGLAATLPTAALLAMDAPTDSALLWALIQHRRRGGADPVAAVSSVVLDVLAAAPGSRLNLLLTDGRRVIATAVTHSLSYRIGAGAVLVSSEPLDADPAWRPVPEGSLLIADTSDVDVSELPGKGFDNDSRA